MRSIALSVILLGLVPATASADPRVVGLGAPAVYGVAQTLHVFAGPLFRFG